MCYKILIFFELFRTSTLETLVTVFKKKNKTSYNFKQTKGIVMKSSAQTTIYMHLLTAAYELHGIHSRDLLHTYYISN